MLRGSWVDARGARVRVVLPGASFTLVQRGGTYELWDKLDGCCVSRTPNFGVAIKRMAKAESAARRGLCVLV